MLIKAESAKISPVLLQIGRRVGTQDLVRLEERVKLNTRFNAEQPAQVRLCQPAALVFLGSECLEGPTRQVASVSSKALGNIIGDFDYHVHTFNCNEMLALKQVASLRHHACPPYGQHLAPPPHRFATTPGSASTSSRNASPRASKLRNWSNDAQACRRRHAARGLRARPQSQRRLRRSDKPCACAGRSPRAKKARRSSACRRRSRKYR